MASTARYCIGMIIMVAMATADYKMLGVAPQGTQLLIECEPGNNITHVASATYGVANCSTKNVIETVEPLCIGKPTCSIRVDDKVFEADAVCQGQKSVLSVEALCSEKAAAEFEPQVAVVTEYLSLDMVQRLLASKGLEIPEHDLREHFDACDNDHDGRINDSEADDLLRRFKNGAGDKKGGGHKPKVEKSKSSNSTDSAPINSGGDRAESDRFNKLMDTLSSLSDDIRSLLKGNKTQSPASNVDNKTSPASNVDNKTPPASNVDNKTPPVSKPPASEISYKVLSPAANSKTADKGSYTVPVPASQAGKAASSPSPKSSPKPEKTPAPTPAAIKLTPLPPNKDSNSTRPLNPIDGKAKPENSTNLSGIGSNTTPSSVRDNSTAKDEEERSTAFKKMMSPPPTTAMVPTSMPPAPLSKNKQGSSKNSSSVYNTIDVMVPNGTGSGNETDMFSTRTVVYIPTGQSRKLLCSGKITDVWFSTYWWPDSPATEHVRHEPDCIHEEDVALDALRQMCLEKQDCLVTTPAATLSPKCPLSLKYVTVAYKCTITPPKLPQ